jgi:hypothetical protein
MFIDMPFRLKTQIHLLCECKFDVNFFSIFEVDKTLVYYNI